MIITLCGSARFEPWFKVLNEHLTLAGHCVFSLAVYPSDKASNKDWYGPREKDILDRVHLMKIDASEAIVVINPYAYLGESTLREIAHAKSKLKLIFALESWGQGNGVRRNMHAHDLVKVKESYGIDDDYGSPIATAGYPGIWHFTLMGEAGPNRNQLFSKLEALHYGIRQPLTALELS